MRRSLTFSLLLFIAVAGAPAITYACGIVDDFAQPPLLLVAVTGALIHATYTLFSLYKRKCVDGTELTYAKYAAIAFFVGSIYMLFRSIAFTTLCIRTPEDEYVDRILGSSTIFVFFLSLGTTIFSSLAVRKKSVERVRPAKVALLMVIAMEVIVLVALLKLTVLYPTEFTGHATPIIAQPLQGSQTTRP